MFHEHGVPQKHAATFTADDRVIVDITVKIEQISNNNITNGNSTVHSIEQFIVSRKLILKKCAKRCKLSSRIVYSESHSFNNCYTHFDLFLAMSYKAALETKRIATNSINMHQSNKYLLSRLRDAISQKQCNK